MGLKERSVYLSKDLKPVTTGVSAPSVSLRSVMVKDPNRKLSNTMFAKVLLSLLALIVVVPCIQLGAITWSSTSNYTPSNNSDSMLSGFALKNAMVKAAPIDDDGDDGTEESSKKITDAAKNEKGYSEDGNNKALYRREANRDKNSFLAIFQRIFVPGYINYTPDAYVPDGKVSDYACDISIAGQGNITYHNCDVPNLGAEFSQDIVNFVVPTGAYGAGQQVVKGVSLIFGYPSMSVLPGNKEIPVDESQRTSKYTGLELFGYNLNYSSYMGEWDYIKVMTGARAMANFGTFDKIMMGGKAILVGVSNAVNNFASDVSKGNVWGVFKGFFGGGYMRDAASASINSIIDTSDYNVFNQLAWYRPDFMSTTYGARSLNSSELASESLKQIQSFLNSYEPKAFQVEGFPDSPEGPPRPTEQVSSCKIMGDTTGALTEEDTSVKNPPGITESECNNKGDAKREALAKTLDDSDPSAAEALRAKTPDYEWDASGTSSQEKISDWEATNGYQAKMEKFNFSCKLPSESSTGTERNKEIDDWYKCLSDEFVAKKQEAQKQGGQAENKKYFEAMFGKLSDKYAGEYAAQHKDSNFNAAYNRVICVDPKTGRDIKLDKGNLTRVYDANGKLTGNCPAIRPPIQNGLFGNGYDYNNKPAVDTRREAFDPVNSYWNAMITDVANLSLGVSGKITQFSNTFLSMSFTPILDALDLRGTVISLIESFRDSVFFPLVILVIAISAFMLLYGAARGGSYTQTLNSFLYTVIAFVLCFAVLSAPARAVKFVDEAPVAIENTVLSVLFGDTKSDDLLCTTSSDAYNGNGKGGEDINGNASFDPNGAVRTLMCENWRTFAFTPWVYGQWGTSFNNLYASNSTNHPSDASTMSNTNSDLVGDGGVNFGNNVVINNWATYQLNAQSIGTSTTVDTSKFPGTVNKNWYRLVDLQMGPNNGAGTDGHLAKKWSQPNSDTWFAMIFGPIVAVAGAATIISYSAVKLMLVFSSIIMIAVLPVMFLVGIHAGKGRYKLRSYCGSLAGILIQRVLITLFLGVMFKILLSASNISGSYITVAIASVVVSLLFLTYRKEAFGMIQSLLDNKMGSFANGFAYRTKENVPLSARNYAANKVAVTEGAVFGTTAALMSGQRGAEVKKSARMVRSDFSSKTGRSQLFTGLAMNQKYRKVTKQVDASIGKKHAGEEYNEAYSALEEAGTQRSNFVNQDDSNVEKTAKVVVNRFTNEVSEKVTYHDLESKGGPELIKSEQTERHALLGLSDTKSAGAATRRYANKFVELERNIQKLERMRGRKIEKAVQKEMKSRGYGGDVDKMSQAQRAKYNIEAADLRVKLSTAGTDGRDPKAVGAKESARIKELEDKKAKLTQNVVRKQDLNLMHNSSDQSRQAYGKLSDVINNAKHTAQHPLTHNRGDED